MKLNSNTHDILKNFSEINTNILIKPGSELNTISTMRNIFAKATITESFDNEFGIYDLNEFLNVATSEAFDSAEFEFQEKSVILKNGRSRCRYYYADPTTIISPSQILTMPDIEVRVKIIGNDLKKIKNMSSVLGKSDFTISSENGDDIIMSVLDKKDPTTNNFEMVIEKIDETDVYEPFLMNMKIENLKIIGGDYTVSLASKGIAHFKNDNMPVEYFIAMADSTYGEQ